MVARWRLDNGLMAATTGEPDSAREAANEKRTEATTLKPRQKSLLHMGITGSAMCITNFTRNAVICSESDIIADIAFQVSPFQVPSPRGPRRALLAAARPRPPLAHWYWHCGTGTSGTLPSSTQADQWHALQV